ncbi:hypothetical protein GMMP15_1490028 [Candidatus Magnetomoraceae bacterium gMMP-15]
MNLYIKYFYNSLKKKMQEEKNFHPISRIWSDTSFSHFTSLSNFVIVLFIFE